MILAIIADHYLIFAMLFMQLRGNTLIIKDHPSVVKMLLKAIKGKDDLSECQNFQNSPKANRQIQPD